MSDCDCDCGYDRVLREWTGLCIEIENAQQHIKLLERVVEEARIGGHGLCEAIEHLDYMLELKKKEGA